MDHPELIARRALLRRVAVLLGATLSAPAVLGVMNGCSARPGRQPTAAFLTGKQMAVVAEVAEIIIPRTDTPGARDVGVPAFIDTMLAHTYPRADQRRYLDGLAAFEDQARRQHGGFLTLAPETRQRFVRHQHDTALTMNAAGSPPAREQRPFILMTRELTLLGYFTSRAGAADILQYDPLPGAFRGCLAVSDAGNGRAWATEMSLPF